MYFKSAFIVAALTTLAAATPAQRRNEPASSCSTGPVQCCNSAQDAKSSAVTGLLALIGISASDITGLVGVTCSPITVIGVGGNSCSAQALCCENNSFKGLVALGCVPVDLSL